MNNQFFVPIGQNWFYLALYTVLTKLEIVPDVAISGALAINMPD
jgi:hypothetical protein